MDGWWLRESCAKAVLERKRIVIAKKRVFIKKRAGQLVMTRMKFFDNAKMCHKASSLKKALVFICSIER
jgi:hypothetical protein